MPWPFSIYTQVRVILISCFHDNITICHSNDCSSLFNQNMMSSNCVRSKQPSQALPRCRSISSLAHLPRHNFSELKRIDQRPQQTAPSINWFCKMSTLSLLVQLRAILYVSSGPRRSTATMAKRERGQARCSPPASCLYQKGQVPLQLCRGPWIKRMVLCGQCLLRLLLYLLMTASPSPGTL